MSTDKKMNTKWRLLHRIMTNCTHPCVKLSEVVQSGESVWSSDESATERDSRYDVMERASTCGMNNNIYIQNYMYK